MEALIVFAAFVVVMVVLEQFSGGAKVKRSGASPKYSKRAHGK
jgi:hypothetical protein